MAKAYVSVIVLAIETKIRGRIVSGLFVPVGHRVGEEQASGKSLRQSDCTSHWKQKYGDRSFQDYS